MNKAQQRGKWGEKLAAAYLCEKGLKVVEKNVRSPFGEIDLVCSQGKELVIVEVKTRSSRVFGYPEEAVTRNKQHKLKQLAEWYWRRVPQYRNVRVDVVAIMVLPDSEAQIEHLVGI